MANFKILHNSAQLVAQLVVPLIFHPGSSIHYSEDLNHLQFRSHSPQIRKRPTIAAMKWIGSTESVSFKNGINPDGLSGLHQGSAGPRITVVRI
jgi:hypothetical protein